MPRVDKQVFYPTSYLIKSDLWQVQTFLGQNTRFFELWDTGYQHEKHRKQCILARTWSLDSVFWDLAKFSEREPDRLLDAERARKEPGTYPRHQVTWMRKERGKSLEPTTDIK